MYKTPIQFVIQIKCDKKGKDLRTWYIKCFRPRDGLTPPPRVITMRDKDTGAEVVTEWQSQHSLRVKQINQ